METSLEGRRITRFGAFELDLRSGELSKEGVPVPLQDKPLRVLELLLERRGEVVTRDELRHVLWPADTFVDFAGGLNTAVNKLRAALGDSAEGARFVETVGRRGYRLIASVEAVEAAAGPPALAPVPATAAPAPSDLPAPRGRRLRPIVMLTGAALVAALGAVLWSKLAPASTPAGIRSLAVLPLKSLSDHSEDDYFADGITEALITQLAGVRSLRVISRQSVMRYKDSHQSLPEIARELGVDAVVEGSVARGDGRVRVSAQLIHAPVDRHLWANSYERDLVDVLALQAEVAAAIAGEVRATLTAPERARLARNRPVDPEAYDLYLRGRYFFNWPTSVAMRKRSVACGGSWNWSRTRGARAEPSPASTPDSIATKRPPENTKARGWPTGWRGSGLCKGTRPICDESWETSRRRGSGSTSHPSLSRPCTPHWGTKSRHSPISRWPPIRRPSASSTWSPPQSSRPASPAQRWGRSSTPSAPILASFNCAGG